MSELISTIEPEEVAAAKSIMDSDPKDLVEAGAGEIKPEDMKAAYMAEYASRFSDPAEAEAVARTISEGYDAAMAKGLVDERGVITGAPTYETDIDRAQAMADAMDNAETTLARARQSEKQISDLETAKEDANFIKKMKLNNEIKAIREAAPIDIDSPEEWNAAYEGSEKRASEAAASYDKQKDSEA